MSGISVEKRLAVYERDGWACRHCGFSQSEAEVLALIEYARENTGLQPPRDRLTIDHVIPLSRGGSSAHENLQTLCARCNSAKGDRVTHAEVGAKRQRRQKARDAFEREGRFIRRRIGSSSHRPFEQYADVLAGMLPHAAGAWSEPADTAERAAVAPHYC